jgi:hypothetical protein
VGKEFLGKDQPPFFADRPNPGGTMEPLDKAYDSRPRPSARFDSSEAAMRRFAERYPETQAGRGGNGALNFMGYK